MSIYRRLFLWFFAANLLTLTVSVLIAHAIFERRADRPPPLEGLVERAQAALASGDASTLDRPDDGRRVVLVREGRTLDDQPLPRLVQRHLEDLTDANAELRLPRGVWLVSRALDRAEPRTWLIVLQGPPRAGPWARWMPLALQILLSVGVIAGVGWVVARHLAQPLSQIQAAVRRIAAGALGSRVEPGVSARADEYGQLARDLDRMAAQIETLVQSRDQLLHDVSHELRAPLSRLRFALELAHEDGNTATLERADREIARIDALVGELLALARLDQAASSTALPRVDLAALARDVVQAEEPQASHRGVSLQLAVQDAQDAQDAQFHGDRDALARALENLIRNAVRHAPPGSAVQVAVQLLRGEIQLSVRDHGPGVASDDLARLFEPFFRAKNASGDGYGLGLAIVSRVIRAHRGRAEAANCADGGLEVRLVLPLAG